MPRITAREILNDIKNGMADDELTEKYQLSAKRLKRLMLKLVQGKAIDHGELYEKSPLYRKLADQLTSRESPRTRVRRPIRIFHDETSQRGYLRDVSRNGVRVAGITATVGDIITLRLPLDEVDEAEPIEFVAECRWSDIEGKLREYVICGFAIKEISDAARIRFDELIERLHAKSRQSYRSPENGLREQIPQEDTGTAGAQPHSRKFSGNVGEVDILDVVQFLLLIGKTAVLRVTSSEGVESRLYVKDGGLIHADLGSLYGEEAFFKCMDLPGGVFSVEPWSAPTAHTISDPGELLLVEAARRRDEALR